jgi:hypothetical protein
MGTITHIRGNKPQTIEEWRDYISEPWQSAVESIVETGRRLIEAKENIGHGGWVKIFEDKKLFSAKTAQRLMAIAQHPILANGAHVYHLPPSWGTLYELSRIPEQALLTWIQDGKVHSELTRSEAEALLQQEKEHAEKMETLRQIIIGNCYQALSLLPCDCGDLKNEITQEVLDAAQKLADNSAQVVVYLKSLGMKE